MKSFSVIALVFIFIIVSLIYLNGNISSRSKNGQDNKLKDLPINITAGNDNRSHERRSYDISLVTNAADQDSAGGPLIFRLIIRGIDAGNCNLVLTDSHSKLSFASKLSFDANYYGCSFTIPMTSLKPNKYKYNISVGNGSIFNDVNGEVQIR